MTIYRERHGITSSPSGQKETRPERPERRPAARETLLTFY